MRNEPHDHDTAASGSFWDRITGRKPMAILAFAALVFAFISPLLPWQNWALWQQEPGVSFEVVSETDVLELYRPLDDLDIVFRGQDLQEGDLNLRIITINVVNSGATHITASDYDNDDWGIAFHAGQVIEARLVGASDDYLGSQSDPLSINAGFVGFPKRVFDKGHFFTIEVLLLHEKEQDPTWSAVGKISGVSEFQTKGLRSSEEEDRSFRASLIVVLRQAGLAGLATFVGISIAYILTRLVIIVTKRFRNWRFSRTLTVRHLHNEEMREALLDLYLGHGAAGIKELCRIVNETNRIHWATPPPGWAFDASGDNVDRWSFGHACDVVAETGVLTKDEGESPVLDPSFASLVRTLTNELGIRSPQSTN